MNKDVEQHLQELIEFYFNTDINDIAYLKKLFVRNLKDVQRRYVKYDKSRKEQLNKAKQFIKENACYDKDVKKCCDDLNYYECDELLAILGDKENDR